MTAKRILVTGASGFIGRHVLGRLLARGFEVHGISHASSFADRELTWHRTNLLDPFAVRELVFRVKPSHLLHTAWTATPGVFWNSPDNLRWLGSGTELLRCFGEAGGQRAMGVGSCAEYDWSYGLCSEHRTPLNPKTVYGQCKLAMCKGFQAGGIIYGFSWAWVRLFFPYGPGEPQAKLISSVIRGLLDGKRVECTHGYQIRDFAFVDDIAEGIAILIDSDETGSFNLGSGRGTRLREIIGEITAYLGHPELVRFGARKLQQNEPQILVADMTRTFDHLAWRPKIDISTGIKRVIAALC